MKVVSSILTIFVCFFVSTTTAEAHPEKKNQKTIQNVHSTSKPTTQPSYPFIKLANKLWRFSKTYMVKTRHTKTLFTMSAKNKLISDAKHAKSLDELGFIFRKFLSKSNLPGATLYTKHDIEYHYYLAWHVPFPPSKRRKHKIWHIGVQYKKIGSLYMLTSVWDGLPAKRVGLLPGDVLTHANGKSFQPINSFASGRPVLLSVLRNKKKLYFNVSPIYQSLPDSLHKATMKSVKVFQSRGKRIGYIHFWNLGNLFRYVPIQKLFQSKLKDTDGLILDLRDGFSDTLWRFRSLFISDPRELAVLSYKHNGKHKVFRMVLGPVKAYKKPMVVLINKGTSAGKEIVAYQFRKSNRATLVGTPTKGIHHDRIVWIKRELHCVLAIPRRYLYVDFMKVLRRRGVQPDIFVSSQFMATEKPDKQLRVGIDTLLKKLLPKHRRLK